MKTEKRIIPVSSGKGGVGKTTFALNYALGLSQHAPTVLIDLDMGTSSIRHALDVPVQHDLYHFFKQARPLRDCVTRLPPRLDPFGRFRNFGFVAAPRHMIDEITNFQRPRRDQLIDAINALDARYVVLDLKAGLDGSVIDFLPYSNSGILLFTPHLRSATVAASDIVKAILFRKLRSIFEPGSSLYQVVKGIAEGEVNELLDQAEDSYDARVPNLDGFAERLHLRLGDHPVVKLVANTIQFFRVHYVLNKFNGVAESYETAVRPFVQNLVENVSAQLTIVNLGWVISHHDIERASIQRLPILVGKEPGDRATAEAFSRLASQYLPAKPKVSLRARVDPTRFLEAELETLTRMQQDLRGAGYEDNFRYIVARSLHVLASRRTADLGDNQIFKRFEFERVLAQRGR